MQKSSTIKAILLLAMITLPHAALSQITKNRINQSNIIVGNNNNVTSTFINNRFAFHPGQLNILTQQLEKHLATVTNSNAESAFQSKKFHLAAEIWDQVYLDGKRLNKKPEVLSGALIRKAEAEAEFDKTSAHETLNRAIQIDLRNLSLHERAASIAIDLFRFDQAKHHLQKIIELTASGGNFPERAQLLYNTHYRLHVIASIEGYFNSTILEAIECSKIFTKQLTPIEQHKTKGAHAVLLSISMRAALQTSTIPKALSTAYLESYEVIQPSRKIDQISTEKKGIWISLRESKIIKVDEKNLGEIHSTMDGIENVPDYVIGETLEDFFGKLLRATSEERLSEVQTEPEARRHLQQLYDDLIETSFRCKNCSINPIALSTGALFTGSFYEGTKDFESAHFFYSLAIRRIQAANDHIRTTPQFLRILINLYEKIGLLRDKLISEQTSFSSENALELPYILAIEAVEKILKDQPNNTSAITLKIRLLHNYHSALKRAYKFRAAYDVCKKTHLLFESITENYFIVSEGTVEPYVQCVQSMLIDNKLRGNTSEFTTNSEILMKLTARAGVTIDESLFKSLEDIKPLQ